LEAAAELHALTAGAIETMMLVMTRVTRGHTGRPLVADRGTVAIYVAVTLAALLRVGVPFVGDYNFVALAVAAGMWSSAYGLFVLLYFGMLTRPRLHQAG
jgi:uncharacterized protein involved in response to NO